MKATRKTLITLLAISSVLSGSLMAQSRSAVTAAPARGSVTLVRPPVNPTFRGDIVVTRGPVVRPHRRHDPLGRIEAARIKAARIKAAREDAANQGGNPRRR